MLFFDRIALVKKRPAPILPTFRKALGRPLRRSVSLRRHSSFKIGGRADYFFAARSAAELSACLRFAREHSLPYYVIGDGTNILFDDEGFRGLILKNEVKGIEKKPREKRVEVLTGTRLADLVEMASEEGLRGIEFAAGIPGTVGGAVFGNAGAFGRCIADILEEAVLLDGQGREFRVRNDYFGFAYRHSCLKKKHLTVLRAVFGLETGDRQKIKDEMAGYLEKRKARHPSSRLAYPGSYFKNPILPDGTKAAAGYLLEKVGAKELRVGRAAVFSGHANFIINLGRARARDVLLLAEKLKSKVKRDFGVALEEEVIYLPADFSRP